MNDNKFEGLAFVLIVLIIVGGMAYKEYLDHTNPLPIDPEETEQLCIRTCRNTCSRLIWDIDPFYADTTNGCKCTCGDP